MPIEIRPYVESDRNALRQLYLVSRRAAFHWEIPTKFALDDFERDTHEEPILVAVASEQLAGFVSWWPPENFIHNLFVSPTCQRQGIGGLLLSAALEQIGRPATLKCVQQNAAALAFYKARGWTIIGEGSRGGAPYFLLQLP